MKCASCTVEVPPTFSKAIMDNICPACGKEIFKPIEFKELLKVKEILKDAGLEDKMTVSIAAILSQKYDIVLKSHGVKRSQTPIITEADINATEGLSEEERMKLRALHAAKQELKAKETEAIKAEWLSAPMEYSASAIVKGETSVPKLVDPELAALFSDMQSGDAELTVPLDEPPSLSSSRNSDRLARAEMLRNDPARFKISRLE